MSTSGYFLILRHSFPEKQTALLCPYAVVIMVSSQENGPATAKVDLWLQLFPRDKAGDQFLLVRIDSLIAET